MQAMKVEKDNLMDRCDACEQVNKALYLRIYWTVCSGSQGRQAEKRKDRGGSQ